MHSEMDVFFVVCTSLTGNNFFGLGIYDGRLEKTYGFFWKCNFFIHGSGVGTNEVQKTYGIRMVDIMWKSTFHLNAKIKKNLLLAKYVRWSYWTLHLSLAALRPCSAMAFISWAFSAKIETYPMYWGVKHNFALLGSSKNVMYKIFLI